MKKIIAFSLFCFFAFSAKAQLYVNGELLDDVFKWKYIEVCTHKIRFNVYRAYVDYGQPKKRSWIEHHEMPITNANGKITTFFSKIAVMNYIDQNGFDVFSALNSPSESSKCILYVREE